MSRHALVIAAAALVACGDVRQKPTQQADGPASGSPTVAASTALAPSANPIHPTNPNASEPSDDAVVVAISKSQILVGEGEKVLELPAPEQAAVTGIDARHKRSGPNDLYIVPLANALIRHHEALSKRTTNSIGEAILLVDEKTSYRVLVEVLYTLGQSGFGKYHLLMRGGGALPITPPSKPATPPPSSSDPALRSLNLALLIVGGGVAVKTSDGNVGPRCKGLEKGIAVPKIGDEHDLDALSRCVASVKAARPEYASETQVTITANPGTPYSEVIAVIDAIRADFPDVQFGVVK